MQRAGSGKTSNSPKPLGSGVVFHNSQRPEFHDEPKNGRFSSGKRVGESKSGEMRQNSQQKPSRVKPKQKLGSQAIHPSISKHIERQKRIENTLRNLAPRVTANSVRRQSQESSKTPESQKTLRKPGIRSTGIGIPEQKIQKIIGKESNILSNYSLLGPEDKIEVQNKIIEILKRKLLQEQRLRLERESELDAILKKDTSTLLDLEEKLMNNDSELGLMLTERRVSSEVIQPLRGTGSSKVDQGKSSLAIATFQKLENIEEIPDGV